MGILGSYKNGNYNVTILSDGTKIRSNNEDYFKADFPESFDIKICNKCDMGCPMCHENSTPNGEIPDIMSESFIDRLNPYTELAIGGGNPLEHPDLIPFLEKCKKFKLIPSMTVNQVHFMKNIDLITELIDRKLIYGLGVSLVNVDDELIDILIQPKFSNVVIHVINGIVSMAELEALRYFDIKILILGYKDFRRGHDLYSIDNKKKAIDGKKEDLKRYLPGIIDDGWFKTISFDNLALKQLDVKNVMSNKDWQKFYMGDDGQATMYIDMCKREFAKSSVSTKRYPLMDNIIDMFNVIKEEN